ncbi:MAG: hypothetical protein ABI162_11410 [Luteolibacter sp.]
MKTLLLPILVGCGTLFPLAQSHAAEPATTTYGGFTPGQKFTLTVTDRTSTRTKGSKVTHDAPVPDGIPDYAIGKKLVFTIGEKGQLMRPAYSITFRREEGDVNFYANKPTFSNPSGRAATITKNSSDKAIAGTLTFSRFHFSGFIPVTNTVTYVLEK